MVFEDMDLNPLALAGGLLGGILSIVVMSKVEVSILIKIFGFIITAVVCYIVSGKILDTG